MIRSKPVPPRSSEEPSLSGVAREDAFEALFRAHFEDLCRYAASQLRDPHAAEDLVQDVFLGLWRQPGALPAHPKAYLFRGARNRVINYNQQQRVARREDVDLAARPPRAAGRADARTGRRELSEVVRGAVEALPERQRQVFDLSRNGHLTYAEIADVLGLSVKTVETHMSRALTKLREQVGRYLSLS